LLLVCKQLSNWQIYFYGWLIAKQHVYGFPQSQLDYSFNSLVEFFLGNQFLLQGFYF
jgi:hypothetical protein